MSDSDSDSFDFPMDAESIARRAEIMQAVPDVEDMPLFLKELPKDGSHPAGDALIALSQLKYEGMSSHEIAEELKRQGNELFRRGTRGDLEKAVEMYDDAILQKSNNDKANSVYHSNKAAALLKLRRFQAALDACLAALEANPGNIKAFYRATKAHVALGSLDMAVRIGQAGLLAAEDEPGGIPAAKELALLLAKVDADVKAKAAAEEAAAAEAAEISSALVARGIVVGAPLFERADGTIDVATISFVDKSVGSMLQFPVLLLYPEAGQTDFIQVFGEADSFGDHLAELYPPQADAPPWDRDGAYRLDTIALYAVTCLSPPLDAAKTKLYNKRLARGAKALRIDLGLSLIAALTQPGYIMPDIPTFHVVVSGSAFEREWLKSPA